MAFTLKINRAVGRKAEGSKKKFTKGKLRQGSGRKKKNGGGRATGMEGGSNRGEIKTGLFFSVHLQKRGVGLSPARGADEVVWALGGKKRSQCGRDDQKRGRKLGNESSTRTPARETRRGGCSSTPPLKKRPS